MKKIWDYLKTIHVERWVWCIAIAMFCWTDVSDYHHMVNNKKLCVWIVLGLYYAYKLGGLKRENRILTIAGLLAGGGFCTFLIKQNVFSSYIYYNYTIGMLGVVLILQYGLLIKKFIRERKRPEFSVVTILFLLMLLFTQASPMSEKNAYGVMFFVLLPYACMELSEQRRRDIFRGMIDGLCLGFVICQGYTFLYRPYVITGNGSRFKSFRDYCTAAGVSYMQFYIGFLLKYVILFEEDHRKWPRILCFWLAGFTLSLMYLTGGRSPVLGSMAVTAVAIAWCYRNHFWRHRWELWIFKCMAIGVLSLALFPVAYAGTRYLPTIINNPDLQDSEGNRINSFATVHLKQKFLYNEEWGFWSVKAGDPVDSVKYITFPECVGDTLCRVIPGLDSILMPIIGDDIFEDKVARATFLLEEGKISAYGACELVRDYCALYGQEIPEYYREYFEMFGEDLYAASDIALKPAGKVVSGNVTNRKDLGTFSGLLRVHAADEEKVEEKTPGRGDSIETGWFDPEEGYSSMQLRNAIHLYTLGKLNLFGHERLSFAMYYLKGDEIYAGNTHNIYLQMGYDYGVPAMLLMAALFVLLGLEAWTESKKQGGAYLLPLMLVLGLSIFGWFECGFGCGNGISTCIFVSAVLWRNERLMINK